MMRKHSSRPRRSITSSSCASCFATSRVIRGYLTFAPSPQSAYRNENAVCPSGTGNPGRRSFPTNEASTRGVFVSKPHLSGRIRSEEHTSELQSHHELVCRLLLEKKNNNSRQAEQRPK